MHCQQVRPSADDVINIFFSSSLTNRLIIIVKPFQPNLVVVSVVVSMVALFVAPRHLA
jgi:hypothetical protein